MKKRFGNILCLALLPLVLFPLACGGGDGREQGGDRPHADYSISEWTEYVDCIGAITGAASPNYTETTDVGGTDLGFPIYDDTRDRMYFLFGDTFSSHEMHGNQRANVLAYVDGWSDADFTRDLKFTGWVTDEGGTARAIAPSRHARSAERTENTKIPTGGICIDGTLYVWYMSIRYWGVGGVWYCNYNGAIKSSDGGQTWERLFDLTWAETDTGSNAETIKRFAEEDLEFKYGGTDLDLSKRVAPNFMQIAPADGKDGYIYLFGCCGGRQGGMQMARVAKADIEDFESYEYCTGFGAGGAPRWQKGSEALKLLRDNDLKTSTTLLMKTRMGETTVFYNPYFEKWVMTDNIDNKIYMAMSKNVYGPYSKKYAVFDVTYDHGREDAYYELYAGFSHEKLLREDGKSMYTVVSYMDEIYNSFLLEVRFA